MPEQNTETDDGAPRGRLTYSEVIRLLLHREHREPKPPSTTVTLKRSTSSGSLGETSIDVSVTSGDAELTNPAEVAATAEAIYRDLRERFPTLARTESAA